MTESDADRAQGHERSIRERSIDPDRLLPGENIDSNLPADVAHWISVYTELRDTKRELVSNLREMMQQRSQDARDELHRADVVLLELQIERFEHRIAFWREKLIEPSGEVGV